MAFRLGAFRQELLAQPTDEAKIAMLPGLVARIGPLTCQELSSLLDAKCKGAAKRQFNVRACECFAPYVTDRGAAEGWIVKYSHGDDQPIIRNYFLYPAAPQPTYAPCGALKTTAYRCSQGCDWDVCEHCFHQTHASDFGGAPPGGLPSWLLSRPEHAAAAPPHGMVHPRGHPKGAFGKGHEPPHAAAAPPAAHSACPSCQGMGGFDTWDKCAAGTLT